MPHGLEIDRALSLLKERQEVWVQRLKEREGVSGAPMRLIAVAGVNGVVMDIRGKNRFRIPLAKLETTSSPRPFVPKHKALIGSVVNSIAAAAEAAPPPLVAAPALPPSAPATPPPPNPREIAVTNNTAQRVIFDVTNRKFYTANHKWSTFIDDARRYAPMIVNRARGRLLGKNGKRKGLTLETFTVAQASAELERLAKPQPVAPTPPPAPVVQPSPPYQQPDHSVGMNGKVALPVISTAAAAGLRDAFDAVLAATRAEAARRTDMLVARAARLLAQDELRLARLRVELNL